MDLHEQEQQRKNAVFFLIIVLSMIKRKKGFQGDFAVHARCQVEICEQLFSTFICEILLKSSEHIGTYGVYNEDLIFKNDLSKPNCINSFNTQQVTDAFVFHFSTSVRA